MGLDQYLYARCYLSDDTHEDIAERVVYDNIAKELDTRKFSDVTRLSIQVVVEVMYWRKMYDIDHWFKENCGYGDEVYVSREKLWELFGLCKQAVANREAPVVLVPSVTTMEGLRIDNTTEATILGGANYDEHDWQVLKRTIVGLAKVLENTPKKYHFYYQSS